ncbi:MAG TPA: hypothetical protein VMC41_00155 [Candidatus Nanoarchaeia archaeon]|nr:hypothetical protein [Candidatus Nanoarchaeia archaeon]
MPESMTPKNPRWKEFRKKLDAAFEGCDPHKKCSDNLQKPIAKEILKKMGDVDIEATFKYFDEHDGYCDCDILFNVR